MFILLSYNRLCLHCLAFVPTGEFSSPVVPSDSFAGVRTSFSGLPSWTKDQNLSRNLLDSRHQVGTAEVPRLADEPLPSSQPHLVRQLLLGE